MTSPNQSAIVEDHVNDALASGARALTGGAKVPGPGDYFEPTVLVDVDHSMKVMRDETFGPVVSVYRFHDEADAIARAELTAAGLDAEIWQCPVVLLADVRSVGVQGDGRTYGHPIVLRPVSSEDAMTADWTRVPYDVLARISNKITNQVPEVNRVVLDVTSKPPGTIEWE